MHRKSSPSRYPRLRAIAGSWRTVLPIVGFTVSAILIWHIYMLTLPLPGRHAMNWTHPAIPRLTVAAATLLCVTSLASVLRYAGYVFQAKTKAAAPRLFIGSIFLFGAVLIAGCALLYFPGGMNEPPAAAPVHTFAAAFYLSVMTFTTVGFGDVQPLGAGRFVASAEGLTALILTGVLVAAVLNLLAASAAPAPSWRFRVVHAGVLPASREPLWAVLDTASLAHPGGELVVSEVTREEAERHAEVLNRQDEDEAGHLRLGQKRA